MASGTRAARALLFQQHCRYPSPFKHPRLAPSSSQARAASDLDASHLDPSNFNRPLRFRDPDKQNRKIRPSNLPVDNDPQRLNLNSPAFIPGARPPTYVHPRAQGPAPMETGYKITAWQWLKKLIFNIEPKFPEKKPVSFHVHNNPYRARKKWPPDFRTLSEKQQFHYEKTYRRRAKRKWTRPTWNKSVKLVQQTLIVTTVIYFVFFCEPAHDQGTPFDGFRAWFFGKLKNLGQLPNSSREEIERLEQDAKDQIEKTAREKEDRKAARGDASAAA